MKKTIIIMLVLSFLLIGINVFAQGKEKENKLIKPFLEKHSTTTSTSTPSTTPSIVLPDPVCVANAINTRETAIISALTTKNNGIITALGVRQTALVQATNATSLKDMKKQINKAKNDFNKTRNALVKTYRQQAQSAWNTFRTTKKQCKNGNWYNDSGDLDLGL
jgi:hypothetical protein